MSASRADLDPAYQRALAHSRDRLGMRLIDRERAVELAAAVIFLAAAIALALLASPPRELDLAITLVLIAVYALASRVEFRIAVGWADPSQLVFVPMLFVLPTQIVPLAVAAALVLARMPEYLTGEVHPARAVLRLADASFALWPAVVLVATGATSPDWADWPVYMLALAAQLTLDGVANMARVRLALGVPPRALARDLGSTMLIDALLAPAGLVLAFGLEEEPAASVLLVPLIYIFRLFAREREARIEHATALSSAYRGTAMLLSEVLSDTDEYTGSHSRSVVVLAHQVGEALGLDEMTLREIEFGALLHDVGKISVPNEIINKPGRLTDEEMEVMRTHTIDGERMLERIGGILGEVGVVVRSHHERWDGKGYPDGLAGEEIPLAARVITACDAFNAMTTDRAYRAAMPLRDAIAELRRNSGTQFDPRVVDALVGIVAGWEGSGQNVTAIAPRVA